jgi:CheY-like chemotaxis protein
LPVAGVNLIPQSTEDRPDLAGYSALLVEDVPSNQTVLTALLVRIGMTSDLACTAAQAREKLQTNRYDFAFVDIQLPDLNGDALARQMREIQPDLKIIAVTAQVSSEIRAACESAGVDAFVPKPIAPSELYEKLRKFTAPSVNALEMLFDYDANKVSQYLAQLDQEQQVWQEELREIVEAPDPNALGRLHHRMKTALGQLQLWKLDRILTELRESLDRGDSTQSQVLCGNALRQLAKLKLIGKRFSLPA